MEPAKAPKSELERLIQEYLEYLEVEKNVSPLTVRNYAHYLRRFSGWMAERAGLADITQDSVRQYRVYLSRLPGGDNGAISRKTQGYHIISLHSLLS